MTHFDQLKNAARQGKYEVGTISGSDAIILRREKGHVVWYLYEDNGVTCIGPTESDDRKIWPQLDGKSLADIVRLIEQHEQTQAIQP